MEEIGIIVVRKKGNFAIVKIEKNDRIGCKECGLCRTGRNGGLYLESENLIGARTGEKVRVEIPGESIFIAAVFIYGIPLAGFILGIVIASVIENVILTLVGGIAGFVLSYFVLNILNSSGLIPYADFHLNFRIFIYGLLITLFFGLFSGVYPAWKMSRMHPVEALREGIR